MFLSLRLLLCGICFLLSEAALAQTSVLPSAVQAALARTQIPSSALAFVVAPTESNAPALMSQHARVPLNPASVMKLVTTYVGLDVLGPAFAWSTPVFVQGPVRDGVLYGNLFIQGRGDPKLTIERLWLLLRRVQALGINAIAGDIVLDHSAFATDSSDPAAFDGEPLRAYNASADALLINFKALNVTLLAQPGNKTAHVSVEPRLAGVQLPVQVPLSESNGDCGDYRSTLKADFSDPAHVRFAGSYPAACGEKQWAFAYAEPDSYANRAVLGLWQDIGGQLGGTVHAGTVPAGLAPAFEFASPSLAEVVRDINKFSNNVMAQQLFLTLSQQQLGAGSAAASRELLRAWWTARFGSQDLPVFDQGSGLSRQQRISAQALVRLLQAAFGSVRMPEFVASLPIAGVDGTLRQAKLAGKLASSAHLKSGSLQGVLAWAGYLHKSDGQWLVFAALINHPNASAGRPVLQALVDAALAGQ